MKFKMRDDTDFFGGLKHAGGRHGHGFGGHANGLGRGMGRGGFFGRFGGGGHGMRAAKMFASGDLQLIILHLLQEKPRHGYDVIKALEERSRGIYIPSPGMVYPALTYLEEMGYASSSVNGNKKLFSIMDAGAEYLVKNRQVVEDALQGLERFGQKMAQVRDQLVNDEDEDESWGGSIREMKMEFREIKHELKAALFEKLRAPSEEKKRVLAVLRRAIAEIRGK